MSFAHHPVFIVLLVAVLAPLLSELPVGRRIPVIVFEVLLGIVVGPHVLGLIPFDRLSRRSSSWAPASPSTSAR